MIGAQGRSARRRFLRAGVAGVVSVAGLGSCSAGGSAEGLALRQVEPLEDYVRLLMQREEIPGVAVAIATAEGVIYAKGFGVTRAGTSEPVTADTVFQIGSTTKAFLGVTLAMVIESGAMSWDDTVRKHMPGFRLSDDSVAARVTPADILAHATGLPSYVDDTMWVLGYPLESRLRAVAQAPLTAGFRERFQYVNNLHQVVGRILASAAGAASWDELLRSRILGPLGMSRSSSTQAGFYASAGHAFGHQHGAHGLESQAQVGRYWYEGVGPAGNMNSTANDMGQWLHLQLGKGRFKGQRLVTSEGMERTWTPVVPASALGWGIGSTGGTRLVGHDGGTASFGSNVSFLPELGIGIAVLTNHRQEGYAAGQSGGVPSAISYSYLDALTGQPERDRRAGFSYAAPSVMPTAVLDHPMAAYSGRYACATLGPCTVLPGDGSLGLVLEEIGAQLLLRPVAGGRFLVEIGPGSGLAEQRIEGFSPLWSGRFAHGADGAATALALSSAEPGSSDDHTLLRTLS